MRYLFDDELKNALEHIAKATEIAQNATCLRSKCGSVVVKLDETIGSGFNSPPQNLEKQRRCSHSKESLHRKVTEKTCCVHAEQRAIMNALKENPDKLQGSRLYFIRLDSKGKPSKAGEPYCTVCSKMALDVGIKEFVLYQGRGVSVYKTTEYNELSFKFGTKDHSLN